MKKLFVYLWAFLPVVVWCSGCSSSDILDSVAQDLTNYEITATLDYENKTLAALENVSYYNKTDSTLGELKFHLYPNAFSKNATVCKAVNDTQSSRAYPNGFSEGNIEVTSVMAEGKEAQFAISGADSNILAITLEDGVQANSKVNLSISFNLTIPNCEHRFGYGKNTLSLGNWFPIACVYEAGEFITDGYSPNGDPFFSEVANFSVAMSYPSKLTMVATGNIESVDTKQDMTTSIYSAKVVRDFACVFSEKFEVKSALVGNTTVSYFYYDDTSADNHLKASVDALTTFNSCFGQYPYKVLNVVKTNFLQGGMEYPQLVYISDAIENEADIVNVIVHEISHQWWYGVVGNNECENAWIDEGLAEFSTALFYDKNPTYGKTSREVLDNALSSYLLFVDVYHDVYDELDTSMNRNIHNFKTETEYVYLTYVKSVLMFDSICDIVGKENVEKSLQTLYKDNMFDIVKPVDVIAAFEKVTHKKLASFINSWLDGSVVFEELNG